MKWSPLKSSPAVIYATLYLKRLDFSRSGDKHRALDLRLVWKHFHLATGILDYIVKCDVLDWLSVDVFIMCECEGTCFKNVTIPGHER